MGAGICATHYTGMAAATFPAGALCVNADQLSGDGLGILVAVSVSLLLTLTLLTSLFDARMQHTTKKLAALLHPATTELQEVAFRDALTGLPNRQLFDDRVSLAVERCTRDETTLAVLFVDWDGFKPINDSFGRSFGDRVLCEMAQRLVQQASTTDTARVRAQIELLHDLRLAIELGEFALHYQPKIDAVRGVITGVEALVRWVIG